MLSEMLRLTVSSSVLTASDQNPARFSLRRRRVQPPTTSEGQPGPPVPVTQLPQPQTPSSFNSLVIRSATMTVPV
ncbi:hypothetical protein DY000_02002981 [Brassica cretica]|uniref:Uncharacterized protein n=1 Tax=Brassica cretica TaxID=69181 RepID=A0ABQ7CFG6_BRACR|nr:hypothetical protein DY000_02002981 [Brassica cretica]